MIPTKDLSHLPVHPAPWHIADGEIRNVAGGRVQAFGVNITAGACFPKSWTQAVSWANGWFRKGVRHLRIHHLEIPLWIWGGEQYETENLQWYFNALARKGITVSIDFASQTDQLDEIAAGDFSGWEPHIAVLCEMDLRNVVMACPVNEPHPTSPEVFEAQCELLRKHGYKGLIYGSNPYRNQPGGIGAVWDCHVYLDHPSKKLGDEGFQFKDTQYAVQWWNHPKPVEGVPFVCTELGVLYPSPNRGNEERAMCDDLWAKGCQVILMFAACTNETHYLSSNKTLDQFAFHSDPERMDTLSYGCLKGQYLPRTFNPGFEAVKVDPWTWQAV